MIIKRPPVSIVILTWNASHATRACFKSLWRTLGPDDEVIVIDNGSTDDTRELIEQNISMISKVQFNDENLGFSAGCNQGAALASNDYIIFLNNDTLLPTRWIERLMSAFESAPAVWAAGPSSNCVAGPQRIKTPELETLEELDAFAAKNDFINRGHVLFLKDIIGFCLAIRKDRFNEVGGFDERFKVGSYEDRDLCLRIVQSGGKLAWVKECFVWHKCHETFRSNNIDLRQNQKAHEKVFREKWTAT